MIPYTFGLGTVFETHSHTMDKKDAIFDGTFEFTMYHQTVVLGPGDTLVVPRNTPHSARVVGNKSVGFLDASKF